MQAKLDPGKLTFRALTFDELKETMHKQNEEGWYLCENEAEAVYSIDPKGFFGAEYEGKLIGTLAIINYGDGFKYGTLYTILKEFRGMGLGPPLFEYGVKQADFEREDESSLGQAEHHIWPIYNKRKWTIYCNEEAYEKVAQSHPPIEGIVDLKTIPLEKLYAYDKKVFGYSRESYLRLLLDHKDHHGVAKLNKDGDVIGYGIVKRLKPDLYKLAPFYADDKEIARDILKNAQNYVIGTPMCLTLMDVHKDAVSLVQEEGLEKVFSGYRIYKGSMPPKTDFSRVFGIGADFY